MPDLPTALYEPGDDGRFHPTALTRGPWDPRHQHAGPPSALLAHVIEEEAGIADGQIARIAVDILRPVPLEPLSAVARVLRGGRRVEQLEAVLATEEGTELMRARAWRMRAEAVSLPEGVGVPEAPPDGPGGLPDAPRPPFWTDEVAYFDALDWRFVHGRFERPGPAACWTRLRVPLVAGAGAATPLEHLLVMADAASGISNTLDWTRFTFANVDFSVALERPPAGAWLAMDAHTRAGDRGAAVCVGVLSDASGRVGVSTQALFVAAR